jgi:Lrp/AsnC family leucine-responsive transcriptional regulator
MRKRRSGLDRYDMAILSALAINPRLTTVELASKVHLSRTAVSRRISALRNMKVLNDGADVLNYESIGFKVRATIEIATNGAAPTAMTKASLLERPEVLSVSVVAGAGSLCLDVIATDMDHLHRFIRSIEGNGETTTRIIYSAEKSHLTLAERMRRLGEETGIAAS